MSMKLITPISIGLGVLTSVAVYFGGDDRAAAFWAGVAVWLISWPIVFIVYFVFNKEEVLANGRMELEIARASIDSRSMKLGPKPKMVCPHCHTAGHVSVFSEKEKQVTEHQRVLGTDKSWTSRWVYRAKCSNCDMVWNVMEQ